MGSAKFHQSGFRYLPHNTTTKYMFEEAQKSTVGLDAGADYRLLLRN